MKKNSILFLLLIPFLIVFIGCDKDDDDEMGSSADLVGVWHLQQSKGWEKTFYFTGGKWVEEDYGKYDNSYEPDDDDARFIHLSKDGEGFISYYDKYRDIYYKDDESFTWTYKNQELIFYYDYGQVEKAKITKLTSSNLNIEYSGKETREDYKYEFFGTVYYKKVTIDSSKIY
ncbi:lipocalin family protein [Bacteroidales bacterium OttesenSCG-928-M06]|nr:lipocalin family protein [Bacteroidales bacterium OttesenSCG-928-M06]